MRALALILMLAVAAPVAAQDPPVPVIVYHDGEPGVWFSEADADRMLEVWRDNRRCQLRIPVLLQQVENRTGRIVNLRRALDLSDRSLTLLEQTLEAVASATVTHWYQSPWFALSIGLILGFAGATVP